MRSELSDLLRQIDDATGRLLATASRISDADVRQPSLLPGWSRGHVLTHVARNADALSNLLTWARTGVPTPAYASPQAREAGIQAGAARSPAELRDDVADSAAAFRSAVLTMPDDAWQAQVGILDSSTFPAAQVLTRRLVEVELHHADLGVGYSAADWPPGSRHWSCPSPCTRYGAAASIVCPRADAAGRSRPGTGGPHQPVPVSGQPPRTARRPPGHGWDARSADGLRAGLHAYGAGVPERTLFGS